MKKTETTMNRAAFLRSLGLSSAALMSIYCLGSVTTACTSKKEDPQPTPNPNPGSQKVDFTLDLTAAANNALNTNEYQWGVCISNQCFPDRCPHDERGICGAFQSLHPRRHNRDLSVRR
jgi:hypothetical protein